MKGLTKSQLLEYVKTKRDAYYDVWKSYKDGGNRIMAKQAWGSYNELYSVYLCMTDNEFARFSYTNWTGKEL